MQEASDEYAAAVASHRTWVPPRLRTDWDGVGYAGDGTIDDLSGQMSESWEVDHTIDDGYPETVTFVSGTSVPEMSTELTGRPDPTTGAPITAPAYWSPLRTDSPVYGYDRDIAPVTLDTGLVTEAGREYVRVFTGQMANTPVRGGKATVETISAARLRLMKLVQAPAFAALYSGGLYATWPVSYNLVQCDLFAGPKIRPSTAWYAPMHGSAWAMIPAGNTVYTEDEARSGSAFPSWSAYERAAPDALITFIPEVPWIRGPYVSAPDLQLTAALRRVLFTTEMRFDQAADDALSQFGNRGRLEMWVRGDAADVNNAPGGSATVSRLCGLTFTALSFGSPEVQLYVSTDRRVVAQLDDGSTVWTLTSAGQLPTDGEWHFVGCGYDWVGQRLWVNLDGVVASSTITASVVLLPDNEVFVSGDPIFQATIPVAEIAFTTGAEANADTYPLWRDDDSFAPNATIYPSTIKLNALAETEPREAWQTIGDYAKAELAAVRLTELDTFEYLPLAWWVRDEQQVVTDLVATDFNADEFDIDLDPTKIRNAVKVSYNQTRVVEVQDGTGYFYPIYEYDSDPITILPGVTVFKVTYSDVGVLPIQNVFATDNSFAPLATGAYFTLCDVADGTGTYAAWDQVVVTFDAWDAVSATLRFTNMTAISWYLVNDVDVPSLRLVGLPVLETSTYVTDYDATSIAARNERSLDVSAPVLQMEESARRLARNLKMNLRSAVATIGADQQGIEVLADPRRQPGDLAVFSDDVTGVSGGLWRLRGVHHKGAGAKYTQSVVARRALPIMIIGEGVIGASLIGPSQD